MLVKLKAHQRLLVTAAAEKAALLGITDAFDDLYEELQRFYVLCGELLSPLEEANRDFAIDSLMLMDTVLEAADRSGEKDKDEFNDMVKARAYIYDQYLDFGRFVSELDHDEFLEGFAEELTSDKVGV